MGKYSFACLAVAVSALSVLGCGQGGGDGATPRFSIIQQAEILPHELVLHGIGDEGSFFVIAVDREGFVVDPEIRWTVRDPNVAEIFDDGRVVAKKGGVTEVVAVIPTTDFAVRAPVVVDVSLAELRIHEAPKELVAGEAPPRAVEVRAVDGMGVTLEGVQGEVTLEVQGIDGGFRYAQSDLLGSGTATFELPVLTVAGSYRLVATLSDSSKGGVAAFRVAPGPPHSLSYRGPEPTRRDDEPLFFDVDITDEFGNRVREDGRRVLVRIDHPEGRLQGLREVEAKEGTASFGPLSIPLDGFYWGLEGNCWKGKSIPLVFSADSLTSLAITLSWKFTFVDMVRSECGILLGRPPVCRDSLLPTERLPEQMVRIEVGNGVLCTLGESGSLYCWGREEAAYFGPVLMPFGRIREFGGGLALLCALTEMGDTYCLDRDTESSSKEPGVVASKVEGPPFEMISVGSLHACGIAQGGDVHCWGDGKFGRLGVGDEDDREIPARVQLPAGESARAVAAGDDFTCAVTETDRVFCWGRLYLEDFTSPSFSLEPPMTDAAVPVEIPLPVDLAVDELGASYDTPCLRSGREVYCWGAFAPLNDNLDRHLKGPYFPVRLPAGETGFTGLRMKGLFQATMAILESGVPFTWRRDRKHSNYAGCSPFQSISDP